MEYSFKLALAKQFALGIVVAIVIDENEIAGQTAENAAASRCKTAPMSACSFSSSVTASGSVGALP